MNHRNCALVAACSCSITIISFGGGHTQSFQGHETVGGFVNVNLSTLFGRTTVIHSSPYFNTD